MPSESSTRSTGLQRRANAAQLLHLPLTGPDLSIGETMNRPWPAVDELQTYIVVLMEFFFEAVSGVSPRENVG